MLGKGLESLIPPSTGSGQGNGDDRPPQSLDSGDAIFAPPAENSQSVDPVPISQGFRSRIGINLPEDGSTSLTAGKKERIASAKPPVVSSSKPEDDHIFHIEVSKIKANPTQPRRDFNEAGIRELALSIREFGFLQPLVVSKIEKETPTGVEVEYQLIAGERRLLAAKMLGLEAVPAIIRRVDLEREKLELAVVENIQREDLNPIEKARALARLQDEFRMTQREIAAKLGKSREVVANSVRLLGLPTYVQEALTKGQITESHGRFLLAVDDPAAQKKLFDDISAQHLTMRQVKERVQGEKFRARAPKEELSPELKMVEERLSAELGTPVKIEPASPSLSGKGVNTGKITITFYSEEELENIVHKIGGGESV